MVQAAYSKTPFTQRDTLTKLAVVIVTYNSADVLPGLLDSIPAGLEGVTNHRVIVVDNDSRDESVAIASLHPAVTEVVETGRNAGYSAGINVAAARVSEDTDILVLNPDIRLSPGCVQKLYAALDRPGVGVAVPLIRHEDGTLAKSIRREPSLVSAWSEALLGGTAAAWLGLGEMVDDPAAYQNRGAVEWTTGAALLISATTRRLVGDWDESFFLYSEEVDYFRRVRTVGLSAEFVPDSEVSHIGGDYQRSDFLNSLLTRNRIEYFRRHHGMAASAIFQLAIVIGTMLRSPVDPVQRAAFKAALTHR